MSGGANPSMTQQPRPAPGGAAPNSMMPMPIRQTMPLRGAVQSGVLNTTHPGGAPQGGKPMGPMPAVQVSPGTQPPTGGQPNVFQQSAQGLTAAMGGAQSAMGYQPQQVQTQFGYRPQQVNAGQALGGIAAYQNPYTNQVVNRAQNDLERQRQMQMNDIGAQASRAGAFGGSRHGVAEALTNEGFARQGADMSAQLRAQGFDTALGASQQDVANRLQAQITNQGANTQASQFGQQMGLQAQIANQGAGMNAMSNRLNAASTLGSLSQMGFNMGNDINKQQAQYGLQQQLTNQALLDAARNQYNGFTGAPLQALQMPMAAVGAANMGQQTQTTQNNPGFFGTLGGLFSLF